MICNPEEEKKKELNGKKGVYVGESAEASLRGRRSIKQTNYKKGGKLHGKAVAVAVVIKVNDEGEETNVVL